MTKARRELLAWKTSEPRFSSTVCTSCVWLTRESLSRCLAVARNSRTLLPTSKTTATAKAVHAIPLSEKVIGQPQRRPEHVLPLQRNYSIGPCYPAPGIQATFAQRPLRTVE